MVKVRISHLVVFWIHIFVDHACLTNFTYVNAFLLYLIKAGINNDNLTIALEPEAASMYCKNIPLVQLTNKEFDIFSKGNQYLILDAGGMHYISNGDKH